MNEKPGVMIYFDMLGLLQRLPDAEAGILFRAILEYGRDGTVIDLPDPLYIIWPIIQMRLDTDDRRYHQVSTKRRYASYVRWIKFEGKDPLPYDDWLASIASVEDECDL